jgi:hypothetical protein
VQAELPLSAYEPLPQVVQALEPLIAKVPPPHVSQPSEVRPSALE